MNTSFRPKGERGTQWHSHYEVGGLPDHEIGIGEWRTSQAPLNTFRVTNCMAVAAINTDTHVSLLGHIGGPDLGPGDDEDYRLFRHALAEIPRLGPVDSTIIGLAGIGIRLMHHVDEEQHAYAPMTRAFVESRTRAMAQLVGISQEAIKTAWLGDNEVLGVRANPYLGKITVHEFTNA